MIPQTGTKANIFLEKTIITLAVSICHVNVRKCCVFLITLTCLYGIIAIVFFTCVVFVLISMKLAPHNYGISMPLFTLK